MGKILWVKTTLDMFSNRKIKIILKERDGDTYFRVWIQLITIAGECNENGKLIISENNPLGVEDFAKIMNKTSKKIEKILNKFIELEMITDEDNTYSIKNWEKYQSADKLEKIKEQDRVRQRRYQERKKAKNNVIKTLDNEREKIREDNNKEEIDNIKEGENDSGFKNIDF